MVLEWTLCDDNAPLDVVAAKEVGTVKSGGRDGEVWIVPITLQSSNGDK